VFFSADDRIHRRELWGSDGTEAGTVLVKDINMGGWFRVASHGQHNIRRGTLRVNVRVAGDGRLVVRPVVGSLLRRSVLEIPSAGRTTIRLRPTRAGMRVLRQHGHLRVRARFTFIPCGGTGSSVIHRYTLRLK
jgi:ELWxxDGT repeat protein